MLYKESIELLCHGCCSVTIWGVRGGDDIAYGSLTMKIKTDHLGVIHQRHPVKWGGGVNKCGRPRTVVHKTNYLDLKHKIIGRFRPIQSGRP